MPAEITKYDALAKYIYELHMDDDWTHFNHLKRKERDYWRALAQVAHENNLLPLEPERLRK